MKYLWIIIGIAAGIILIFSKEVLATFGEIVGGGQNSPIMLFHMNGASLADSSGWGNTLTNNSNVSSTLQGKFGGAFDFGNCPTCTPWLQATAPSGFSQVGTYVAWIYPYNELTGDGGAYVFDTSPTGNLNSLQLLTNATCKNTTALKSACVIAYDGTQLNGAINFSTSSWHQVVKTKDAAFRTCLYIDGQADACGTTSNITVGTSFRLGNYGGTGQNTFRGKIDEVAIYKEVLTPTQVKNLYIAQSGQFMEQLQ